MNWITGSSDTPDSGSSGGGTASLSNLTVPITWSTTTSYRSGSDTGNNIGFDSTADDFYIKMSRSTSKMIIRNTDGELAEFGPFIKFYESIVPSTRATLTLGSDSQMWAHVNSWALIAHSYIKIKSGAHSDSVASNGEMWFDGSSVKIKSNGAVKNIDDIGGVAPISASWSSLTNDMIPSTSGDYDIGSSSKRWDNLYLSGLLTGSRISLSGNLVMSSGILTAGTLHSNGETQINGTLDHDGSQIGFFGTSPAVKQTGPNDMTRTYDSLKHSIPTGNTRSMLSLLATAIDTLTELLENYGLLTKPSV